jgi:hypothetical protein
MIKRVRRIVREMIGRTGNVFRSIQMTWAAPARDITRADYEFWDKLRRGKAKGLEIAGLLVKPITSKIRDWAMGTPPQIEVQGPAQDELNAWWGKNHADILRGYKESLDLGDAYIVVNGDLSVTVLPPDVVEPIVDEEDYSSIIGWRVVERHPHPTRPGDWMTIEDEYMADERVRRIRRRGVVEREERYPNVIGRVPVVPIHNNRGSNDEFGSPECAAMIHALHEYGEVLDAGLFGNKRQGRPTPSIEFKDLNSLNAFWDEYAVTETKENSDGTVTTFETIPFSADELMAVVGKMTYAQPGSFAGDTEILLGLLYLIFLEHSELPEFVLGSAIASSKASTETQMPVFEKFITAKRQMALGWILDLLNVVQLLMVARGELAGVSEDITVRFEDLTQDDATMVLSALQWLHGEGLIDEETAVTLSPVEIRDVKRVLRKARKEREDSREQDYQRLLARAQAEMGDDAPEDEDAQNTPPQELDPAA